MNDAPWKTRRACCRSTQRPRSARWLLALATLVAALLVLPACGEDTGGGRGGGREDTGSVGGPDVAAEEDTGTPPADTGAVDTPPPVDVVGTDTPPVEDVPPVPITITILEPAEGEPVRRGDPTDPVEFKVRIEHPSGIAGVEFGAEGQTGDRRIFMTDTDPDGAPSGEFTFALHDYYVPDGTPLDPEAVQRRWPGEGEETFYVRAVPVDGTADTATRTIYIDATPPELVITDSPLDRGLEVLDVVGQLRVQFRASDTHALKESRVTITWPEGEEQRTLAPSRTNEFLVIKDMGDNVPLAQVRIETEDTAGWLNTITLDVRIVRKPPYRLGHVFEFPGGAQVRGFVIGHYDDSDAGDPYPDLWVATSQGLWLLLGAEGGEFEGGYKLLDAGGVEWERLFLHDFDHDGLEDLLLAGLDGTTLRATVAIRHPAAVAGNIDDFIPYPDAAIVEDASLAVDLDFIDGDDWVDFVVGLEAAEDSVAVLLGYPLDADLPLVGVEDPLDPARPCDPACEGAFQCVGGLCVLPVLEADDCEYTCAVDDDGEALEGCLCPGETTKCPCPSGFACLAHPALPAPGCQPLDQDDVCGGCRPGERCIQGSCRRFVTDDCGTECAAPYACSYGECVLFETEDCPQPCAAYETCHRTQCVLRSGGSCDPSCGERQVCQFGTCVTLDTTCNPGCLTGEVCHEGQCVRHCGEDGCPPAPDYLPFFFRPNYLRGVAGISDLDIEDFNEDGRNDVVVGRRGVRQISCYLGLGDGDFVDAFDTYLDDDPFLVVPYLIPGEDQSLDLIVSSEAREHLYVLRGDGQGFFDIASVDNRAVVITEVVPADVTQPGDIVFLQPGASLLRVFRHDSDASFSGGGAFSAGLNPAGLAVANMDADPLGLADVVYFNAGTSRLVVGLGLVQPVGDFDLPPEILNPPRGPGESVEGPAELIDIAVGEVVPRPSTANDFDDVVALTSLSPPPGAGAVDIGLDAPEECGSPISVNQGQIVRLLTYPSDGLRPGNRVEQSDLHTIFNETPGALALGHFDSDVGMDAVVTIPREAGEETTWENCICTPPEDGEGEPVCEVDPDSETIVKIPNVAIARGTPQDRPGGPQAGQFTTYGSPDPAQPIVLSLAGLGFATDGEPEEYLPESDPGRKGFQIPSGVFTMALTNDPYDDVVVLSTDYKTIDDDDFAPAQITTWRAPLNGNGVFDGPRFGATIGRDAVWTTIVSPTVDTFDSLPDVIISNSGDDDLTVLRQLGQLRFHAPRYIATHGTPLGIASANLDVTDDSYQDFVVAVDGNVQIGYGREPLSSSAFWSFDDVVFLYPGETYPRDEPTGVQVADLNRDGQPDIVVSNQGSDTLTVFFGVTEDDRPHPLFPVYVDCPTGHGPAKLLQGRFNSDDCPDFVVANQLSESMTLLLSIPELCQ